ncbi:MULTISPECIES: Ppx/GppA phosphatase family protein [Bacteroidota]|jgi:exopolyphosphatase/guanosine-5'-triphosphate,3'-diphosphate pyrophosphatase|uniref:Phosphatase n=3 Tax=Flectobacillus TaxID=101 RepID=A0ABT6YXC7_9BACT|nr:MULTISPECIES: phosphatase [Bacteroidota]MDI9859121.1 phosphatase [Flectobacillus roseus]MDI9865104.1 phosphatase [Flectobacillus longus]MDI9873526.1 phosphatase [Flectobacillus rivi]NBB31178.1 phosphatase [Cellulophaga sp. BC115SP]
MKIAAIDIGSNAARMQISKVLENDGKISFKKVEYVRFALRLGHDVFNEGEISPESEVRIFKLLNAYKLLMDLHEVKDYMICATSAMREAGNAEAIITRIHKILDMKINIIDGSKEAELINDVVVQALDDSNYLHIDVGGGSTELNIYMNRQKVASRSFKIGSVRLLEHKEREGDWEKMRKWIEMHVDPSKSQVTAVGTGGNINKLFNIASNHDTETSMSLKELTKIKEYVAGFTYEERINKLRLNADRADVIVPAAEIYLNAMKWAGAKSIIVPDLGLKDGIIQMVYEKIQNRKRDK